MKIVKNEITAENDPAITALLPNAEDTVWFDIETTGLSSKVSIIYLIGFIVCENGKAIMTQLLADDLDSEKEILHYFCKLMNDKKYLIHYNGDGFDIPFVRNRCEKYGLAFPREILTSIDIFKELRHYKDFFHLPDLKQPTVEMFMHTGRMDHTNGGELISVYSRYLKMALTGDAKASDLENVLLLHNHDDVLGMYKMRPLLAFLLGMKEPKSFFKDVKMRDSGDELIITAAIPVCPGSGEDSCGVYNIKTVTGTDGVFLEISAPVYEAELKFFYKDYKDYYYIPDEDMAVHKSIAEFMPKEKRVKAKASNCYTRHTGRFVPIPHEFADRFHVLKKDYKSKEYFAEVKEILGSGTL